MKTMAEVISLHSQIGRDEKGQFCTGCNHRYVYAAQRGLNLQACEHVAAQLTAAGFGVVAEPVVIHVHHDTEAHARSYNEGYEDAVMQGLADDPSLAGDWLDAKLADAKREALEEAADNIDQWIKAGADEPAHPYETSKWLRARAAAVRGEG